ncbi:MAG: MFS transporter [Planctomycetales bacterium]|nr:MFS transporter [Planctomycetales bacterium]
MTSDKNRRLFLGCFIGLAATSFGFAVRGAVLGDWEAQFGLTEEQKGIINGVGVYPFAISIILFSLIVDRIGYGTAMVFAFVGHIVSTVLTIFAPNFLTLYLATFLYALSNGVVESVINPVVATIYKDNKTKWLNVLHAGWPGGLVLGGLLSILVTTMGDSVGASLPGKIWQWQMAILLLPILVYGFLLRGVRFPTQERVEAGVSFDDMLKEFGWGSAYIVSFLIVMGVSQVLTVLNIQPVDWRVALGIAILPAALFGIKVRGAFGRPMFVFILLLMFLLATTELGTDGWIQDIMGSVLQNKTMGTWFIVYTSAIMFVLRFFAGPIVHRISPLGLLAASSALAVVGLIWLGNAGTGAGVLFLAATLYGVGKTFFWPTTLGVVSEQYPRGGALLLNAVTGVGMIAVGTLGGPYIGTIQDADFNQIVEEQSPEVHQTVAARKSGLFSTYEYIDKTKFDSLDEQQREQLAALERTTKQHALAKIAVLPAIMFVCYVGLIAYFRTKGGYKAEVLTGHAAEDEKFTGGTVGPGEG